MGRGGLQNTVRRLPDRARVHVRIIRGLLRGQDLRDTGIGPCKDRFPMVPRLGFENILQTLDLLGPKALVMLRLKSLILRQTESLEKLRVELRLQTLHRDKATI